MRGPQPDKLLVSSTHSFSFACCLRQRCCEHAHQTGVCRCGVLHLHLERQELPRVWDLARKGQARGLLPDNGTELQRCERCLINAPKLLHTKAEAVIGNNRLAMLVCLQASVCHEPERDAGRRELLMHQGLECLLQFLCRGADNSAARHVCHAANVLQLALFSDDAHDRNDNALAHELEGEGAEDFARVRDHCGLMHRTNTHVADPVRAQVHLGAAGRESSGEHECGPKRGLSRRLQCID